jgi:hypothetical protein
VDSLVVDSSELTINDSPATYFIDPYSVVAALDLSDEIKHAASILFSSATLRLFNPPLMITLTPSS